MAVALLICAAGVAQAQTQAAPPDDNGAGDPPSRAARLSYRAGEVNLLPAGEKDWGDASLNRPLTTGDRLATGNGGRAELELGGGSLRIADDSDFGFLTLNDQLTQVELTQGTLNLAVRGLADGQSYEIDTPTVALVVDQPGTYRVDISDDGKSTRITDFNGRGMVYGEGGAQRALAGGRTYEFGDSTLNNVTISDVSGGDDFDAWCNSRDQRYAQPESGRYVSDDVVGYQDLDQYGNWQADPEYGQVWYPSNVGADWAPYRDGHWAYVGPWGWTWVDASPWGFAPYHYGRWAYVRSRWCWVPGPVSVRPVYAPALVAFVGGGGFGVSVGVGGPVGWFPLGPGEIYNPWYRASRGYYTNVNVTNIYVRNNRQVVINNINNHYNYFRQGRSMPNERYFNREAPRAFTAMSGQDFAAARNAQRHMVTADPRRFANAPVMPRGAGVQPVRASFAPPRPNNGRELPTGGFNREVVARNAPAANFADRAPGVRGTPRSQPGPTNVRMLNDAAPSHRLGTSGRVADMPAQERAVPERNAIPGTNERQPVMRNGEAPGPRPGELPSARFARPQPSMDRTSAAPDMRRPEPGNAPGEMRPGGEQAGRFSRQVQGDNQPSPAERANAGNQPRPGVSYIRNADEDRAARTQPSSGSLPGSPRFERPQAAPDAPRPAMNQDNGARFQREEATSRPMRQEPRQVAQPRDAQPDRGYPRPQQAYQPPHGGYEPPRAPQQQAQPRPAQNEGQQHSSGGHEDRHPPRKDDQHD
ncbi:MAG TPA: DUF6600 domain-containing protein [Dyella sp.]|uniref:DUF6600 domain-containing protein n=1 Tax=Dyella sp. TaxID=1869338 RepID=UPI002D8DC8ED|nr:DUF6600 domain-containing protein [Dyella sp.]